MKYGIKGVYWYDSEKNKRIIDGAFLCGPESIQAVLEILMPFVSVQRQSIKDGTFDIEEADRILSKFKWGPFNEGDFRFEVWE